MKMGMEERIRLASIDVSRQVAEAQAGVLGEAMKTANIDIVGGDGQFLNTFFKSISLAKSVDGFVEKSDVVQQFADGAPALAQLSKPLSGHLKQQPKDVADGAEHQTDDEPGPPLKQNINGRPATSSTPSLV